MYEPSFGLRARPFASAPDPDFYFESRGHHRALAYLRHGIAERESFMVMTGEIGAGKTTLVRKLLRELDTRTIEVALLLSSQLDARELLGAAASAFGEPVSTHPVDELKALLQGALGRLAAEGKRALLVIDEAQNLRPDAIDLLIESAEPQREGVLALQVLLVGQPELQERIQKAAARLHPQTVFIHCHVGCLSEQETRHYIEHRLRHVGWTGSPSFIPAAFAVIHVRTGGVPRRINRLCDRLLLAAYLGGQNELSPRLVEQVDGELGAETGEGAPTRPSAPARQGPKPGHQIPTLSAYVTPQPPAGTVHGTAGDAPSPRQPPPAAQPAQTRPPAHKVSAAAALAGALALLLLAAGWLGRGTPPEAPLQATPAPAPPPTAPVPTPAAQPPVPRPQPLPPAAAQAPAPGTPACTAAVVALGLCSSSPSPPTSKE